MRRKQIMQAVRSRFECQRCNRCCEQPGHVFLSGKDISNMAEYLHMESSEVIEKYCRVEEGQTVLQGQENEACIFLEKQGCRIHPAKPKQCRQFPFQWHDAAAFDYCEGIQKLKKSQ